MKKTWNILDTFAGIGGFSHGMEKTGRFKTVGFVEIDPFAVKILKRHWPEVPIYGDIKELTAERIRTDRLIRKRIDVITGGFPCTDVSLIGDQAGIDGAATGLWRELARCIGDIRPEIAILENVAALLAGDRGRWFGEVLGDLAALRYNVEWHCIPASSVGAPHRRDRVFAICSDADKALADADRLERRARKKSGQPSGSPPGERARDGRRPLSDTYGERLERLLFKRSEARTAYRSGDGNNPSWWEIEPDFCRVADGIPERVDRLRSLGNAIVPEIATLIAEAIIEREDDLNNP